MKGSATTTNNKIRQLNVIKPEDAFITETKIKDSETQFTKNIKNALKTNAFFQYPFNRFCRIY